MICGFSEASKWARLKLQATRGWVCVKSGVLNQNQLVIIFQSRSSSFLTLSNAYNSINYNLSVQATGGALLLLINLSEWRHPRSSAAVVVQKDRQIMSLAAKLMNWRDEKMRKSPITTFSVTFCRQTHSHSVFSHTHTFMYSKHVPMAENIRISES